MTNPIAPSFVVGETYQDHRGAYKVVTVDENRIIYDYGDGIQQKGNPEIKWRIHRNIVSEQSPSQTTHSTHPFRSANDEQFWTYHEVSPIFADVIKSYGRGHKDFMSHEKIIASFIEHPQGQVILNRSHDSRSNLYWVGVMLAWFSKIFTDGNSQWEKTFERKKISSAWAYRVRRRENATRK
jgi:hypothetical protein